MERCRFQIYTSPFTGSPLRVELALDDSRNATMFTKTLNISTAWFFDLVLDLFPMIVIKAQKYGIFSAIS